MSAQADNSAGALRNYYDEILHAQTVTHDYPVMAPIEADFTSLAYFASTPVV